MSYLPSEPIVFCAKDAAIVMGKSLETARRYLRKIRRHLGKSPDHFITLREFCAFFGLDEAEVRAHLRRG
ncbi:hypothetical protein WJU16_05940 [Chitinophaga pollutisoli]|uniref:Uncharacterized protein n=1 Tax=Chitinophaga pollutisoli TaxID=3133966 RepID=A0ABZ2YUR3_9BACT